jgi:hypothetical protein
MRVLNMGDGHPGAAGGVIRTSSRKEAEAKKNSIIKEIFRLWKLQQENPVGT